MNRLHLTLPAACGFALTGLLSCATVAQADDQEVFFEKKIRPVFVEHCLKCHGEKKSENGLRVDSLEALTKGGDIGPAIVPGEPEKSLLILAIKYEKEDLEMPPKGKLDDAIIADLEKWVKDGAHWPAKAKSQATAKNIAAVRMTIEAFSKEKPPTVFEKKIDRLLALPERAPRWGRHGLDAAR